MCDTRQQWACRAIKAVWQLSKEGCKLESVVTDTVERLSVVYWLPEQQADKKNITRKCNACPKREAKENYKEVHLPFLCTNLSIQETKSE